MIADADIFVSSVARRLGHVFDGVASIAGRRVSVKEPYQVLRRDERGQEVFRGTLDFVVSFAQLRFDILQAKVLVKILLCGKGSLVTVQGAGDGRQLLEMRLATRAGDHLQSPVFFSGELDAQQDAGRKRKDGIVFS